MHVFTYGSLMFEKVWKRVVLGKYENHMGTLHGYRRRCLKNETYPVAFEGSTHERIWGRVYFDLSKEDLERLDVFEGSQYLRQKVDIVLDDGRKIEANVYILKEEYYDEINDNPWDSEWFEHVGMAQFLEKYQGFDEVS
jgi:gamma-glutamylcyclotransferase (GGCT)/AIG2-like uncharacterized protein YtfP